MRLDRQTRFNNYSNCLIEFKREMQTGLITNPSEIAKKNKVSKVLINELINNRVVRKIDGFYIWNDKIPISNKLVNTMMRCVSDNLKKYNNPEKQKKEVKKVDVKKISKQNTLILGEVKDLKIGLIRKFLRWIY